MLWRRKDDKENRKEDEGGHLDSNAHKVVRLGEHRPASSINKSKSVLGLPLHVADSTPSTAQ